MYIPFAPKLYHLEKKRSHIVHKGTNTDIITNFTNSRVNKKKTKNTLKQEGPEGPGSLT